MTLGMAKRQTSISRDILEMELIELVQWVISATNIKRKTKTGFKNFNVYDVLNSTCRSVTQICPTLCNPMDCSTPGFLVIHHLLEFEQTHVSWIDLAIQPSHPLSSPSPPAFNLSQHQCLFQWVNSSNRKRIY